MSIIRSQGFALVVRRFKNQFRTTYLVASSGAVIGLRRPPRVPSVTPDPLPVVRLGLRFPLPRIIASSTAMAVSKIFFVFLVALFSANALNFKDCGENSI